MEIFGSILRLYLITTCLSSNISCKKMSEHFPTNNLHEMPIKVVISGVKGYLNIMTEEDRKESIAGRELWQRALQNGGRLNLTIRPELGGFDAGVCNNSGICNGVLGIVQRGEADAAWLWANPASYPFESIQPGPTIADGQLVIITGRDHNDETRNVLATDVYKNFSGIFFVEFLFVVYITSFAMAFLWSWKTNQIKVEQITRQSLDAFWHTYALLVDEEYFNPFCLAMKLLWVSISIAVFVIAQGYVFNLLSTDLVNVIRKPQIDTLEDLEKPENFNQTIILLKGQVAQTQFEAKPADSIEQRLLARKSLLDFNEGSLMTTFADMRKGVENRSFANIISRWTYEANFALGICIVYPDTRQKTYMSKSKIGGGLIGFFSRKMNPRPIAMRYVDYRTRVNIEGGLAFKLWKNLNELGIGQLLGQSASHGTFKCLDGVQDEISYEKRLSDIKLLIPALSSSVYMLFIGLFIALVLVIVEIHVYEFLAFRKSHRNFKIPVDRSLQNQSSHFVPEKFRFRRNALRLPPIYEKFYAAPQAW